jgi:endonuclease/exonuclease/phosphatase family metal-dependent hydrolase
MHRTGAGLGWLTAAAMAGGVGLSLLPREYHRYQIAVEATRETWLAPAPALALLSAVTRRPLLSAAFGALTAELLRTADLSGPPRPAAREAEPAGDAHSPGDAGAAGFRLVTANLLLINRRMPRLTAELLADGADVIVLQELTARHLEALRAGGLLERFGYHLTDPRPHWNGSALLSRWPLRDARVLEFAGAPMCAADVLTPDGPVHIVAVHAMNPAGRGQLAPWRRQHELLAEHAATRDVPVVLAGDYNATVHQRPMRALLASGLRDAFAEPRAAAAGWSPVTGRRTGMTWPCWRSPLLPVMRLDHVLVGEGIAVRGLGRAGSAGSDHLRLIADLQLVRDRDGAAAAQA